MDLENYNGELHISAVVVRTLLRICGKNMYDRVKSVEIWKECLQFDVNVMRMIENGQGSLRGII